MREVRRVWRRCGRLGWLPFLPGAPYKADGSGTSTYGQSADCLVLCRILSLLRADNSDNLWSLLLSHQSVVLALVAPGPKSGEEMLKRGVVRSTEYGVVQTEFEGEEGRGGRDRERPSAYQVPYSVLT